MQKTVHLEESTKEIVTLMKKKLKTQDFLVVAFDGMSASGKTTIAKEVANIIQADIIHMDDFFLQDHQRTKERFKEIGGNSDYERFIKEVVLPLQKQESFGYRPYNCQTKSFMDEVVIEKSVVLIEGAYSCQASWSSLIDLCVVFLVEEGQQIARIKKRETPKMVTRFIEEWIPYENNYLKARDLKTCADLLVLS